MKRISREAWHIIIIMICVFIFTAGLALVAASSEDEDPAEYLREERQSCMERDGIVKEDAYGYYSGCLIDAP